MEIQPDREKEGRKKPLTGQIDRERETKKKERNVCISLFRHEPCFRVEIILLGKLGSHAVQESSEILLPRQQLNAREMIYTLKLEGMHSDKHYN